MPTHEDVLGFSNSWYIKGIESKISYNLPDGTEIAIFPPEIYLASKLEAFKQRGGKDLRQSHDFEDIIYILENNADILTHFNNSDTQVKEYLEKEFHSLLLRKDISEGIESALPYGSDSDAVANILGTIQSISGTI